MISDSRLMRAAPRREARLGPKGESGGAEGNRPTILSTHEAGCRMPTPEGITRADEIHRTQAELDNISFLAALKRYFDNGGRG